MVAATLVGFWLLLLHGKLRVQQHIHQWPCHCSPKRGERRKVGGFKWNIVFCTELTCSIGRLCGFFFSARNMQAKYCRGFWMIHASKERKLRIPPTISPDVSYIVRHTYQFDFLLTRDVLVRWKENGSEGLFVLIVVNSMPSRLS